MLLQKLYNFLMRLHRKKNNEPEICSDNADKFVKNMYVIVKKQEEESKSKWIIHLLIGTNTDAEIHPYFFRNIFVELSKKISIKHIEGGKKIELIIKSKHPAQMLELVYMGKNETRIPLVQKERDYPFPVVPKIID